MKKKMRISYSLLSAWMKGSVQEAVECYFRLEKTHSTLAMEDGRKIHKEIADHITKSHSLPDFLPKFALISPIAEKELIVPYNELFDIKVIIDCLDIPLFYEWKTGGQDSIDWARTYQIPMYFLVLGMSGVKVDSAVLAHYNQKTKEKDFVIIHNSPTIIEEAKNFIDSTAPEIFQYFSDNGLI